MSNEHSVKHCPSPSGLISKTNTLLNFLLSNLYIPPCIEKFLKSIVFKSLEEAFAS